MPKYLVRDGLDIYAPREAVGKLAQEIGFQRRECAELVIVVSELCTNILKYGVRGSLEVESCLDATYGAGLVVIARDVGPPFRDFKMALQDGCDDRGPIDPGTLMRRGGLGIGLGAVRRLTDFLNVEHGVDGKSIRAVRYLRRPPRKSTRPPPRPP